MLGHKLFNAAVQMARHYGRYDILLMKKAQEIVKRLGDKVEPVIDVDDDETSRKAIIATLEVNKIKVEYERSFRTAFSETTTRQEKVILLGEKDELVINVDDDKACRQAIIDTIEADRIKVEYEGRFRLAFEKTVASLVARKLNNYESTKSLCRRLNVEYKLSGRRNLRVHFVEEAARARVAYVAKTLRSAPRDYRTSNALHAAAASTVPSPTPSAPAGVSKNADHGNGDAMEEQVGEESVYYTEEDLQTFCRRMEKEGLMAGGEIFIDAKLLEGSDITPDDYRWKEQE